MQAPGTVVSTPSGLVEGAVEDGVRRWRGIPYAQPPVGPLRWQPPQPVLPWPGVRPALAFGPDFPQAPNAGSQAPGQSEDCLYLNVWSPAGAEPGTLPVMVWFHGGGFVAGSGADVRCDGRHLARRGVVVVSFNYRSGVFGFFAHPALSRESAQGHSGNYGLLDQLALLRWVQDHIAGFGGDPHRVTVFGVSAGSASIALLLGSPLAQGLFQRAILHSPGCGRPLATLAEAEAAGQAVDADLEALRALGADQVLALTPRLNPAVRGLTTPRVLRPILDGRVIVRDERDAFAAGQLHRMPLIVGTNADEGSWLTRGWPIRTVAEFQALIRSNFPGAEDGALALYGCDQDDQVRARVAEVFADTQFNAGARLLLRAMSRLGSPCWAYHFTRRRPGQADGPHHGDEFGYAFGNLSAGRTGAAEAFDDHDTRLAGAMMDAWTTFAATGEPGPVSGRHWPRFGDGEAHLELGSEVRPGRNARSGALDFVDRFVAAGGAAR